MAGMVVQHNMNALNSYNRLNANVAGLKKASEKLSSGYRINRAGDDAAGLAISEKMRSQIRGLNQAKRNSQDGISMIQTYEGALQETHSILQRMKELAAESANGTYDNATDRAAIQLEFDQLNDELNQIADTDFNGVVALNGGVMSDGTKADGYGAIDYSTATRGAQQIGSAGGFVVGLGTDGYTGTAKETVTFTASIDDAGKVTWEAGANAQGNLTMNADNGGFAYDGATVHIDSTKIVAGDTITIEFAPKEAAKAVTPEVIGTTTDMGAVTLAAGDTYTAATLTGVQAPTSEGMAAALNALNGMTIESTFATSATAPTAQKINGQALPTTTTNVKVADLGDLGSVELDQNKDFYYVDAAGAKTKIASYTAAAASANPTTAGTTTTKINVSTAAYTPEKAASITIIEPDAQVSVSNAYDKSVAKMTYAKSITLQVGARTKDAVDFTFSYESDGIGELKANLDVSAREGGLNTANLSLASQSDANAAIDQIDNAINKVSMVRATFGSIQNRLEHKIENLTATAENMTEAESTIRDTDMASEMMNYTKYNILQQAAQSMLAQANQQPQSILQLLG